MAAIDSFFWMFITKKEEFAERFLFFALFFRKL